jgi:hypothetical protein
VQLHPSVLTGHAALFLPACLPAALPSSQAVVLAKYLESSYSAAMAGKTVVELGAGTGVAGIAASILGAAKVFITDLPYTLPNARENVRLNSGALNGDVVVTELDWCVLAWAWCTYRVRSSSSTNVAVRHRSVMRFRCTPVAYQWRASEGCCVASCAFAARRCVLTPG